MKKKCRIVPPDWLNVGKDIIPPATSALSSYRTEYLEERLKEETSSLEFSKLPFRFAEVSKIVLDV